MTIRTKNIPQLVHMVAASLLFALVSPAIASAEEFAQYTAEQQELNERGVRAIIAKDYALAVAVLEESKALGKLNITYLNLGRAYQKLGDCEAASEAYAKAKSAPRVKAPAPRVVEKKIREYAAELSDECAEKTSQIAAVDEATDAGPDETYAETDAPSESQTDAPISAPQTTHVAANDDEAGSPVWIWAVTGSGVAFMGAGIGALLWADSLRNEIHNAPRRDGYVIEVTRQQALDNASNAQMLDALGIGMSIGGALMTAGGMYLLVSGDSDAPDKVAVSPMSGGLNILWTRNF